MKYKPIRIRLIPRGSMQNEPMEMHHEKNRREEFWYSVCPLLLEKDDSLVRVEEKFYQKLGSAIHEALINKLSQPLYLTEGMALHKKYDELLSSLHRTITKEERDIRYYRKDGGLFESEIAEALREWDKMYLQKLDMLTHLKERRAKVIQESPGFNKIQEKVAAASLVTFSVQIVGYSSLNLDLVVGSLKGIAEVFENDFESFRVFLEVFVPQAIRGTIVDMDGEPPICEMQVPKSYTREFTLESTQSNPDTAEPGDPKTQTGEGKQLDPPEGGEKKSASLERAEWLWRLANGSLLVPILLALIVFWIGLSMLNDINKSRNEILKPVLEHQVKILEEDRWRLLMKQPAQTGQQAPTQPSQQAPTQTGRQP